MFLFQSEIFENLKYECVTRLLTAFFFQILKGMKQGDMLQGAQGYASHDFEGMVIQLNENPENSTHVGATRSY
jgi:hypothetical protein